MSDSSSGIHRLECARDDLRDSRTRSFIGSLRLEQLRVSEHDTKLVIQLVKQQAQVVFAGRFVPDVSQVLRQVHARPMVVMAAPVAGRVLGCASRHSVSAKMRMDPPAVRMYSTFPAEIQL